jgi:ribosomal protein S18 acetylase RimI-like enzyme
MTISTLGAFQERGQARRPSFEALDNFFWHALSGAQACFTNGTGSIRRLAPGFAPLMATADPHRPDIDALAPYCRPGERLHCLDWAGEASERWRNEAEATLCRMVWNAAMPANHDAVDLVRLDHSHLSQVLDLVQRAHSGPFGERMLELGDYFGCFANGRLVAMSGERLHVDAYREISAVCTDPEYRGQGLAQALVRRLVHRQMQRRETPMLHVRLENALARQLYERMGFREHCRTTVRIVSYLGEGGNR